MRQAEGVQAVLTAPDSAHAYQLWLIDDGVAMSAGVLGAGEPGAAHYVTGVRGVDELGLSLEPAGGSARPTDVLAVLPLA